MTSGDSLQDETPRRALPLAVWILLYIAFIGLPFIGLRICRAIGTLECILGILAAVVVQVGLTMVMSVADKSPFAPFVIQLMMSSYYLIVMWQYLAGKKVNLWSEKALPQWRLAARFFGAFIGLSIATTVGGFLFSHGLLG